ncbi:putative spermidine/putrescine transport system permease protein [Cryobacterium mesophilum]|uniref:ABC transporter permease n=1 Tax=Terrimesophilobacter mesophilus TaxID=433647 RepID=A0A4R8VCI2_9MICO|nr:ABC transporter permease [Terrimesophilobacter mesophilus]MBB5633722.1 putative spermidine/putrescine transport system permease protein [Terrimesophilobacter mesophilus]TFB80405.1 ABC transporter permease [Terrimesophilobacter mesophilus]
MTQLVVRERRAERQKGERRKSPFRWLVWVAAIFFFLNLFGVIASVLANSFATEWFDTWLPSGWTTKYYQTAWQDFQLADTLIVTMQVAVTVVVVSLIIGAPAAYVLARREFPGKKALMLSFLLPIMVPPITYGIPLATLLYKLHLGGTLNGVILANLVPAVPFVVLVMTPFIEQIDPKIEAAARMCGAKTWQIFTRILGPLVIPGLLAAALLVLVQTVALFELTFLTAGPGTQTLVVSLYYAVFASGIRPSQAISAMAVIYMLTTLVILVIALRYVSPTQMVTQIKDNSDD